MCSFRCLFGAKRSVGTKLTQSHIGRFCTFFDSKIKVVSIWRICFARFLRFSRGKKYLADNKYTPPCAIFAFPQSYLTVPSIAVVTVQPARQVTVATTAALYYLERKPDFGAEAMTTVIELERRRTCGFTCSTAGHLFGREREAGKRKQPGRSPIN